ncbi:MAG: YihY family inner membrane protein [Dehalococcoidia bacterium]|nr:YihY family inner membrane protein [Dehalococcoidia bacterium]
MSVRPDVSRNDATGGRAGAAAPRVGRYSRERRRSRQALRILGRAATDFVEDRCTHLAAAISYYALFSLFPLTLLVFSIFGVVLRSESVQQGVLDAILEQLPVDPARAGTVQTALERAAALGPSLSVLALLGALWTAGALSAAVRAALNVVFDAHRSRPFLRGKMVDYMLLPIIGIPLVGGIVLTAGWRITREVVTEIPFVEGRLGWLWELGALAIPLVLSFVAFLLLYWVIPNRRQPLRYIWAGALFAAVGFEVLKAGFTLYLAYFASYDVMYGPISGVIVLLFWVFITSVVMLFGAQIASETEHVMQEEPRHGHAQAAGDEGDWWRSVWSLVRGMVLVTDEETVAGHPEPLTDAPLSKVTAFVTRQGVRGTELLVIRHPHAGTLLPAGTSQAGEQPSDAVMREVEVECGLDRVELVRQLAKIPQLLGERQLMLLEPVAMQEATLTRGLAVDTVEREDGSVRLRSNGHEAWVPAGSLTADVDRYLYQLEPTVVTSGRWTRRVEDGGGLEWTLEWVSLEEAEADLVPQHADWLRLVRSRLTPDDGVPA